MTLKGHIALISLALIASSAASVPQPAAFIRIRPDQIHWVDVPDGKGVQTATLLGDPTRSGFYVIRARFPPHIMDRPHWHPNARYVTVIQGTWYTGTGPVFDVRQAVPLPAGSIMMHPARAAHWDGSATDETVIVQITGEGPGSTTPVHPAQPFWVDVS